MDAPKVSSCSRNFNCVFFDVLELMLAETVALVAKLPMSSKLPGAVVPIPKLPVFMKELPPLVPVNLIRAEEVAVPPIKTSSVILVGDRAPRALCQYCPAPPEICPRVANSLLLTASAPLTLPEN